MKTAMVTWRVITPLYAGTGQDSSSVIDLPVARETVTGFPVVPSSTIKGVLRDGVGVVNPDLDRVDTQVALQRFGYTDAKHGNEKVSRIGDLTFVDGRLLALAVASWRGTFALITCPMVIHRLNELRLYYQMAELPVPPEPAASDELEILIGAGNKIATNNNQVVINDFDFSATESEEVSQLADHLLVDELQKQRLGIVHDDVFTFLCEIALEVTAHNRLDPQTKTVVPGGLWYQEDIPSESVLTSFVASESNDLTVLNERRFLQLGGKSTTGHGLVAQCSVEESRC